MRNTPLILIVDDEREITQLLTRSIEDAGMYAQVCFRGEDAVRFLSENFANLMILDLNLQDENGFDILGTLKSRQLAPPTIFISGSQDVDTKVHALSMGGDDYITKPLAMDEVVARIQAVLRRSETANDFKVNENTWISEGPFEFAGAEVCPCEMTVRFANGNTEKIGKKELGILSYLAQKTGSVITRKSLIHAIWGEHANVRSRSIDQYIVKIRRLFEQNNQPLYSFRTIHSVGYFYDPKALVDQRINYAECP